MQSGRAYDNLTVERGYGLELQWTWPTWERRDGFSLGISVEYNANANGKRFPYVVFHFGSRVSQIGWLWG